MADGSKVFMDALSEYLSGEEWQQSVEMFVSENCISFKSAKEFSHDHHKMWKTYQEIVETILDMALSIMGSGNLTELERALEQQVNKPVRGPRDAATRDVLERLLTYTNFEHFSHMMHTAFIERSPTERPRSAAKLDRHKDSLVNLGFPADMITQLLSERALAGGDDTLEDLVMALSEMQATPQSHGRRQTGAPANTSGASEADKQKALELSLNAQSFRSAASPTPAKLQFLQKFIDDGRLNEDVSELFAKFTMARSVLETFNDR